MNTLDVGISGIRGFIVQLYKNEFVHMIGLMTKQRLKFRLLRIDSRGRVISTLTLKKSALILCPLRTYLPFPGHHLNLNMDFLVY